MSIATAAASPVNLENGDNSLISKLDRIRIWKGNSPDEKATTGLQGGADDRVFRLDRTALNEVHVPRHRPQGIGRHAAQVTCYDRGKANGESHATP